MKTIFFLSLFCFETCFANAPTLIVTSATGSLGGEIARTLAPDCNLILTGRNLLKLEQLKTELSSQYSQKYEIAVLDYVDNETIADFKKKLTLLSKEIAGLVLIPPRPDFLKNEFPEEAQWLLQFQRTFTGPLEVCRAVMPHFKQGGKIVLINGVTSVQFMPEYGSACVIRRMWGAYAKALSHQLGPKEISVNILSPGVVLTEFHEERIAKKAKDNELTYDEQMDAEVAHIPLRRHAKPSEVAHAVKFLLSEDSDFINGINLVIDGGSTVSY